jgi:hypothetical protein
VSQQVWKNKDPSMLEGPEPRIDRIFPFTAIGVVSIILEWDVTE